VVVKVGKSKLIEIFEEYKPIVRGKSNFGKYPALYEVVRRKEPKKVTLESLKEYVKKLNEKYPEYGFRIYQKGKFLVLDRKPFRKDKRGRKKFVHQRVPIYFDLEEQKFYLPESYLKRSKKLVNYIIMRTLGALGVSTTKYIKTIPEVAPEGKPKVERKKVKPKIKPIKKVKVPIEDLSEPISEVKVKVKRKELKEAKPKVKGTVKMLGKTRCVKCGRVGYITFRETKVTDKKTGNTYTYKYFYVRFLHKYGKKYFYKDVYLGKEVNPKLIICPKCREKSGSG